MFQCCLTSTETIKAISDGAPRTASSTFSQLLSSGEVKSTVMWGLMSSEAGLTGDIGDKKSSRVKGGLRKLRCSRVCRALWSNGYESLLGCHASESCSLLGWTWFCCCFVWCYYLKFFYIYIFWGGGVGRGVVVVRGCFPPPPQFFFLLLFLLPQHEHHRQCRAPFPSPFFKILVELLSPPPPLPPPPPPTHTPFASPSPPLPLVKSIQNKNKTTCVLCNSTMNYAGTVGLCCTWKF